mmetsp:Transcript_30047/g.48440  ORF Transcript_30047/g.48440 Transcript_30047/m.48440 type:complete len:503 (-) Transcript_30047:159-1667(-)
MAPPSIAVCGYLTDVESNYDYFERYLKISKILEWTDNSHTKLKFKRDDAMFVFGGDSQDKGIGDIRFTKLLVALKTEYPTRVELIIGNRDANKLRLTSELHEECIHDAHVLTDTAFPYWLDESKRVTPQMHLDKNEGANNTSAMRLRYILKETMGADGAFDRRREELAVIQKCSTTAVSDDQVVQSYKDECDPAKDDNWMLQYLELGKLAYVFGSNLFVHGALTSTNVGTVPEKKKRFAKVKAWVRALNSWAQSEVHAFRTDPYSGKTTNNRKGFGLMDYGVPGGNKGATVVYNHFLCNGNGAHLPRDVQQFLISNKITTVVTGHQPHGDCPCVMRTGLITVITADTSYSHMGAKSWWGVDNRGGTCVSEVLLYPDGSSEVHGVLADSTKIAYKLGGGEGDKFVGRQLSNGCWVKAKTQGPNAEYILCLGEGFKLTVSRATEAEMLALKLSDFMQKVDEVHPQAVSWVLILACAAAAAAIAYTHLDGERYVAEASLWVKRFL